MGLMLTLNCPACGYQSNLLYDGWGSFARMEIMHCRTCDELVSVVQEINPQAPGRTIASMTPRLGKCPDCRGEELERLEEPYVCPRCGATLEMGKDGGLWD